MTIIYLPILPPNLRPIVNIPGNSIITTDLNYIYSSIINNNNKIHKLKQMKIPENYLINEKQSLQEKINNLIDGSTKKMSI